MRTATAFTLAASLLLAACGGSGQPPNGFTYPGLQAHEKYFPLMGTAHEPATSPPAPDFCSRCHAVASFRSPVNCRGCHFALADPLANPDSIHGTSVAGYVSARDQVPLRTDFCRDCHPLGQAGVTDAAHHTFFPVGAGTKHNRACVACHGSADKKDFAALRCVVCHEDSSKFPNPAAWRSLASVHARIQQPEYPVSPNATHCLRCHDRAQVLDARHPPLRGPIVGASGPCDGKGRGDTGVGDEHCGVGGLTACWKCHDMVPPYFGGPQPGLAGRSWAQDWSRADGCKTCH